MKEKKMFRDDNEVLSKICFVLIAIMVVLQFLPYWSYDGGSTSIGGYLWFPLEQEALVNYLESALGTAVDFGGGFGASLIILVVGVAALLLQLALPKFPSCPIAAVVIGVAGLWGYSSSAAFGLGSFSWLFTVLFILALVAGAIGVILKIGELTRPV